jgi:hypothetical protein
MEGPGMGEKNAGGRAIGRSRAQAMHPTYTNPRVILRAYGQVEIDERVAKCTDRGTKAKYVKSYRIRGANGLSSKAVLSNDRTGTKDSLKWRTPGFAPDATMLGDINEWIKENYPESHVRAHW